MQFVNGFIDIRCFKPNMCNIGPFHLSLLDHVHFSCLTCRQQDNGQYVSLRHTAIMLDNCVNEAMIDTRTMQRVALLHLYTDNGYNVIRK